ncbi:MAG: FecCD family ABC transporter permease [Anaerovoracaceae bacterium]
MAAKKTDARIVIALILLPLAFLVMSICIGRYGISPKDILYSFIQWISGRDMGVSDATYSVAIRIRLERGIEGLLVGGALAVSGACFQSIFRNPLVSSGMLGVSGGAGFGAALSILLFSGTVMTSFFAFAFGILAVILAYFVGKTNGGSQALTLVLGGIIVQSIFSALISLLKYVADPMGQLPAITFWLMGSLAGTKTEELVIAVIPMVLGMVGIFLFRWRLNVLSMGDREARTLGVNVDLNRGILIGFATLATAGAVSVAGVVGWIGLVVPHMCRMMMGSDNKWIIPASISVGGCFMVGVDTLCRTVTGGEIPLGIMTALVGAPFFIYLLKKTKGKDW